MLQTDESAAHSEVQPYANQIILPQGRYSLSVIFTPSSAFNFSMAAFVTALSASSVPHIRQR
jgi:hypothetical protein